MNMSDLFSNTFQSIRSLIVGDQDKYISGQVIQIKTTDQNGAEHNEYVTSSMAEVALKKPKNTREIDFTSEDSIMSRIEGITYKTMFASKFIKIDEITGEEYEETCPDLLIRVIPGSQLIYYPPAGVVYCHTDNLLLFRCICINFMILHNIIPFKITSLQENQIFKIKRSGGFIQRAYLDNNSGIRVSKNNGKLGLKLGFNSDNTQIINKQNPFVEGKICESNPFLDYNKSVILEEFCQLNNIGVITVDYHQIKFTQNEIDAQAASQPALAIVLEKINTKLETYFNKITENTYLKINAIKN